MGLKATILVFALACPGGSVLANDPWEADPNDGGQATKSYLLAGQSQAGRDLQGGPTPDQDWVWISTLPRHSYEARAIGGTHWAAVGSSQGARLQRLDTGLVVQQTGSDEGLGSIRGHWIRWIAGDTQALAYLRVTGGAGAIEDASPYVLELFDTTYSLPRWNNSSSQFTILFLQNNTPSQVNAFVHFFDAAGVLLHSAPLTIPPDGLAVLNASTITALAGKSGTARIAHTGGRGALSGKAVALEPGTGFTFDTAIAPVLP